MPYHPRDTGAFLVCMSICGVEEFGWLILNGDISFLTTSHSESNIILFTAKSNVFADQNLLVIKKHVGYGHLLLNDAMHFLSGN
ncbi:hypothetical protein WN943_013356 [Citrus x changshan-huyou]